jgi:hypothetical protein
MEMEEARAQAEDALSEQQRARHQGDLESAQTSLEKAQQHPLCKHQFLHHLISSPHSYPLFKQIELAYSGGVMPKDADAIAGTLTQQSQLQIYFSPTG